MTRTEAGATVLQCARTSAPVETRCRITRQFDKLTCGTLLEAARRSSLPKRCSRTTPAIPSCHLRPRGSLKRSVPLRRAPRRGLWPDGTRDAQALFDAYPALVPSRSPGPVCNDRARATHTNVGNTLVRSTVRGSVCWSTAGDPFRRPWGGDRGTSALPDRVRPALAPTFRSEHERGTAPALPRRTLRRPGVDNGSVVCDVRVNEYSGACARFLPLGHHPDVAAEVHRAALFARRTLRPPRHNDHGSYTCWRAPPTWNGPPQPEVSNHDRSNPASSRPTPATGHAPKRPRGLKYLSPRIS